MGVEVLNVALNEENEVLKREIEELRARLVPPNDPERTYQ